MKSMQSNRKKTTGKPTAKPAEKSAANVAAKLWSAVAALLLCIVVATGCGGQASQAQTQAGDPQAGNLQTEEIQIAESITFTDDLGRQVTVSNPQRVAALLGSYADIWYLAGGTICASADDAWDDFDLPLPEDAVNLGMTKKLSLEKLFEANPDFILASSNTQLNLDWLDTLEQAGIPTAYFEVNDFEDYLRVLKICTQITGREDLYETNGLSIRSQIEDVIAASQARVQAAGEAPTVLSLRASATWIRAKNSQDNVLGEMLAALGCINIADSEAALLENLNLEYIIQMDPDYIFIAQQGDLDGIQEYVDSFIRENPAWSELTAVKEGRVYIMEKSLYTLKPNDRWAEAYEKLEGILSGE